MLGRYLAISTNLPDPSFNIKALWEKVGFCWFDFKVTQLKFVYDLSISVSCLSQIDSSGD